LARDWNEDDAAVISVVAFCLQSGLIIAFSCYEKVQTKGTSSPLNGTQCSVWFMDMGMAMVGKRLERARLIQ
jgi:hypothetical protein